VVARGIRAINLISQLTSRIPHLMKQSHLETNEGKLVCPSYINRTLANKKLTSMVGLLASHLPSTYHAVH